MKYNTLLDLKDSDLEKEIFMVRLGVNVPVSDGKIENDFRLRAVVETLDFLIEKKAKVVLLGHIGRNKEENLELVFAWLKQRYGERIFFDSETFLDFDVKKIKAKVEQLEPGAMLLLDNLRSSEHEQNNDQETAQDLSTLADYFVNEAFSVSHRKHMSVNALPQSFVPENRYIGLQYQKEKENLARLRNLENNSTVGNGPRVFVLGGAKVATKAPMIQNLFDTFELIVIGGAVANSLYKQMGYEIGKSLVNESFVWEESFLKKLMGSKKVFVPNIVVTDHGEKEIGEVKKEDTILDISPNAFFEIEQDLNEAKFVFFNGPVGFYEGGYTAGTKFLLESLAHEQKYFIAGGGNTVSAIFEMGLEEKIDFISTGGGALLAALSKEDNP